jgi:hypothetical protein
VEDPNSALMPTVICLNTPPSPETSLGVLRAFTRETSQADIRNVAESMLITMEGLPSARTTAPMAGPTMMATLLMVSVIALPAARSSSPSSCGSIAIVAGS